MGNNLCYSDTPKLGQLQQLEDNLNTKNAKVQSHVNVVANNFEEIKEEKIQESEVQEQKKEAQNSLEQFVHNHQHNDGHHEHHSHQPHPETQHQHQQIKGVHESHEHHQHKQHNHQHHQQHQNHQHHQQHQHHQHKQPEQHQQRHLQHQHTHQHSHQQHQPTRQVQQVQQVQEVSHPVQEKIQTPPLSPSVIEAIQKHNFFQTQFSSIEAPATRKYGQDVYVGQLDEEKVRPNGLGKMYKQDGSIYIGHFKHGKAHGRGAFIFGNGSFYQGQFHNNKAETTEGFGQFNSPHLNYKGGFKDNTFHGFGKQKGDHHQFEGHYSNGTRSDGTLSWKAADGDYEYKGPFNSHNKFQGKGILIEPLGVYKGQFVDGKKHGEGQYQQKNGVKYVGGYASNQRSGYGTIYNDDSTIAYQGQLQNGLPHGKGTIKEDDGRVVETNWVHGIDSSVI